jgi:hypothetical protein
VDPLQAREAAARQRVEELQAEAARRRIRLHVPLDLVHVAEHTWTAAHALHPIGSRAAETWAADQLTAILTGHADHAAAGMTVQAAAERLPAAGREAVTTCHRHRTGHLVQLHHDTAPTAGRPITTGARCGLDAAETVLQLRAIVTNGDFEDYWIFHTAREHRAD